MTDCNIYCNNSLSYIKNIILILITQDTQSYPPSAKRAKKDSEALKLKLTQNDELTMLASGAAARLTQHRKLTFIISQAIAFRAKV